MGVVSGNGELERLFVHVGEHEDVSGQGVAGDGWQAAVGFELRGEFVALFDLFYGNAGREGDGVGHVFVSFGSQRVVG